jgi:beta-lactamase class A
MPERLHRIAAMCAMFAILLSLMPSLAFAQGAPPSRQMVARSSELLSILSGDGGEEAFFAPSFVQAVPLNQFRSLTAQLRSQYGEPLSISQIAAKNANEADVTIGYERAQVRMRLVLDAPAPHRVIGLLITSVEIGGDTLQTVISELSALNGDVAVQAVQLSGGQTRELAALAPNQRLAVASVSKLYILGAIAQDVRLRRRRWEEIVPLSDKSLPSGMLQDWPDGTPLTLQSLATLMIAISDNSAADTLVRHIGRDSIAAFAQQSGHGDPDALLPFLTTLELFALKMPQNSDLARRYAQGNESEQAELLASNRQRLSRGNVDAANLTNTPKRIDSIEWFASPADINRLLLQLASEPDPVVRAILTINPLIGPGDAGRWQWLGAKNGFEPGVVSLAFAGQSRAGSVIVLSASWNNAREPLDNARFQALIGRLLNLLSVY